MPKKPAEKPAVQEIPARSFSLQEPTNVRPAPLPDCDACLTPRLWHRLAAFRHHAMARGAADRHDTGDPGGMRPGGARRSSAGERPERADFGAIAVPVATHQPSGAGDPGG